MQARELFGVAVRIAALVFLVFAIFDLTHLGMKLTGIPDPSSYPVSADLFASIVYLVIAMAGLLAADPIVRLCYGRDEKRSPN